MPEQTFRSPNFFEREIDLSAPTPATPSGVPGGVIGTANKGPAFVPVTVGNFDEFVSKFGNLDPKKHGPYAVNEFLKNKTALTYLRVLGAGSNNSDADISDTMDTGRVKNAGMFLSGVASTSDPRRSCGIVQFLVANHTLNDENEGVIPMFSENTSVVNNNFIRGMFMTPETARVMIMNAKTDVYSDTMDDNASASEEGKFKIVISSSLGNTFGNTDGKTGVRIMTASFDPSSQDYFAKVMNTDPDKFLSEQHLLYADFPIDYELATVNNNAIAILSGTLKTSTSSGDKTLTMLQTFGSYNTRFQSPQTSWFISQPFGDVEYDLFKFEAVDDGEYANTLYKIAIADLKASLDESNPYGTFTVNVRDWNDTDVNPVVLESFVNCSLNPVAENYVGKLVGDRKVTYNFDMADESERRIVTSGKYPNASKYVRIVMNDAVERGIVPSNCLPFGFRGMQLLKTTDTLLSDPQIEDESRLTGVDVSNALRGSILPPIPFRVKVTKGRAKESGGLWYGEPASTETPFSLYHWGVKFERNNVALAPNGSNERNGLLSSYTKFFGLEKLDTFVTGSGADQFNDNKFTLAKVALSATDTTNLTGSIVQHMKETAYIRNGIIDSTDYTIDDGVLGNRYTFATLLAKLTPSEFNKYSQYTKFVTFLHGGWDGVNILDRDARRLNDKANSFDSGAGLTFVSPGFSTNFAGATVDNSSVMSYKTAVNIMTDPMTVNVNVLAIPGIRESYITDYTMNKVRDYGLSYYVMDVPAYDDNSNRLFDDSTARPSVDETISVFDSRGIDNNYVGTYFPDVFIDDAVNRRRVKVPASVAALGALAFNDRVAYPWFAPAGFNRAALDFVTNVGVRLNVSDRDSLYDSRINPIATFPRLGYVIYGQKTLQVSKSALDRVNVRRLLLEVKRVVIGIAQRLIFEQNTPEVRNRFVADASLALSTIQSQAGVEAFQVVMNETNNSQADVDANRLNGRIVVVPTRVIEYIAIDFIITNSGVQFV